METFKDLLSGCEVGFCQPLFDYICAKKEGRIVPPYIPTWDLMPLHKLCRLALIWQAAGFEQEARELAHWLLPFQEFLPLWCPEKEFNEEETKSLFAKLTEIDPLSPQVPSEFSVDVFRGQWLQSAFTISGNGTSLGVIRAGDIEIRAFGPQALPLTEASSFGIKGTGMQGWTRCSAQAEVWLEMKTESSEEECKIDMRFIGLQPEAPLAFVFYLKAKECQVGNEIFKPKSLRRYSGEASQVIFENKIKIESQFPHKVQVIPLAGGGCFWDCEFLVSFEMHPFESQANFTIKRHL